MKILKEIEEVANQIKKDHIKQKRLKNNKDKSRSNSRQKSKDPNTHGKKDSKSRETGRGSNSFSQNNRNNQVLFDKRQNQIRVKTKKLVKYIDNEELEFNELLKQLKKFVNKYEERRR